MSSSINWLQYVELQNEGSVLSAALFLVRVGVGGKVHALELVPQYFVFVQRLVE